MKIIRKNMYVLIPNNYDELINVKSFDIEDGCLIIYQPEEAVGYNSHQWANFSLQAEYGG